MEPRPNLYISEAAIQHNSEQTPDTPLISVTSHELGWMQEEQTTIPLELVTLQSGNNIYLGDAYVGSVEKYMNMHFRQEEKKKIEAENFLRLRLDEFFFNNPSGKLDFKNIEVIDNERSAKTINYVKKADSLRFYFMVMPKIEDTPVVLRIAICPHKNNQSRLLKIISNDKKPQI